MKTPEETTLIEFVSSGPYEAGFRFNLDGKLHRVSYNINMKSIDLSRLLREAAKYVELLDCQAPTI